MKMLTIPILTVLSKRQEEILRRLRADPAYVEQQIRRNLGFARPDETLFRFEE